MHDQTSPSDIAPDDASFDSILAQAAVDTGFTTAFRGYDKDEVDTAIGDLKSRIRAAGDEIAALKDERHRANADLESVRERIAELEDAAQDAAAGRSDEVERVRAEDAAERGRLTESLAQAKADLAAAHAQTAQAQKQVQALTEELSGTSESSPNKKHFEEILRVAEEQASTLIRNASVQGDRLLEAAREEVDNRRAQAQADAEAIIAEAQHEAQQARLRIETEVTAHQAQLDREAAHSAEKVEQAQREAAAIRSEAEKGAAALRSMVARETSRDRSEAEEAVRELRVRTLEFEESLTRRQDDAHQEFLALHNQAVAHAERITKDANDQVTAAADHAKRVTEKADDYEKLARAQARQIEADAQVRAGAHLEQARVKAQKIMDLVTANAQDVLTDAEDRARQLRWQQHQLTSFLAEVKELIRPASTLPVADAAAQPPADGADLGSSADDAVAASEELETAS
jgi:cell division septum initiation protein DivIVA